MEKEQNPFGSSKNKNETAQVENEKSEILISVANSSLVRIDSKIIEDVNEQLENLQSKLTVLRNALKETGLQEDNKNVQTPRGSNDNMDLVDETSYSEFINSMKRLDSHPNMKYTRVVEINEDLIKISKNHSLAHCVAEDLNTESGISLQFSPEFSRRGELFNQRQKQGGLAILSCPSRFIYYLVVKKFIIDKPTLHNMWNSLIRMRRHMQENNVDNVAIPRIGCDFYGLDWNNVKFMIEHIFKGTDVTIIVCHFKPKESVFTISRIINAPFPAIKIKLDMMIVYFGTEDGFINGAMREVAETFRILPDYTRGPRTVGQVIRTETFFRNYLILGLIVKNSPMDVLDYTVVEKCARKVKKINKNLGNQAYRVLAVDRFRDPPDDEWQFHQVLDILSKIVTNVDIYVCNPSNLRYLCS